MNWREYYAQQLSVGYVDGISWNNLPKLAQVAQIQHIHGDSYNLHISGGAQQQFNMGSVFGTQQNGQEEVC